MSDAEKEVQERHYKKIDRGVFRITLMQIVTFISVVGCFLSWYQNRDEKQIIDGSVLANQMINLRQDFKQGRAKDSIITKQQRILDSISMAKKFADLKNDITQDISKKLVTTDKRLSQLEKRMRVSFVQEIKKQGASGPVSIVQPGKNK